MALEMVSEALTLFCCWPSFLSPSAPMKPPMASFAEPTFWFHEPWPRFGSSLATPPSGVAEKGPSLPTVCEAEDSTEALSRWASPLA